MSEDVIYRENAVDAVNEWLKQNNFPTFGEGLLHLVPSADRPQIIVDEHTVEWICKYVNEYKVDIDIHIDANGEVSVSVCPTYRDRDTALRRRKGADDE